jgi:hypothetical protein
MMSGRKVSTRTKIKNKRGQGTLENYKSWFEVGEVSSLGRKHRVRSFTVGRPHHLLSDLEYHYFLLFDFNRRVVDIREQYPLELHDTIRIAKENNLKHPIEIETGDFYTMTTDFYLTLDSGEEFAITVKPSKELDKESTIMKFEIERRYYEERGIPWKIATEKKLPMEKIRILKSCYYYYEIENLGSEFYNQNYYVKLVSELCNRLSNSDNVTPLILVLKEFDSDMSLKSGTGIALYKHLIARHFISIDMDTRIDLRKPLKLKDDIDFVIEVENDIYK